METILVCDDEKDIRNGLRIFLELKGYHVLEAENGQQVLEIVQKDKVDLVVLDWMMPVLDGIQTLTQLRAFSDVPVIALTAKSEDTDKVQGLIAGADDYVTKPYVPEVLLARIRAQLRRYLQWMRPVETSAQVLTLGMIEVDTVRQKVTLAGEEVPLTRKEYELLLFFLCHPNRTFSSRELYEAVWKEKPLGSEGTVAVHVRHLREKLEIDPANPRYLKVVWGRGYRMEAEK